MGIPIHNAKNVLLSQNPGTLPNVSDALGDWFQPILMIKVIKLQVNYQTLERGDPIHFQGVLQPASARELQMKPEGERDWSWFTLHAYPTLILVPDDIVWIQTVRYRVMKQTDYAVYGYVEYQMIQDYQDQTVPPPVPCGGVKTFSDNISLEDPSNLTFDVTVIGDGGLTNAFEAEWQIFLLNDDGSLSKYHAAGAIQVIDELTVRITVLAAGVYKLTGVQ